ncbi:PAS domain-containing protein [Pontibacillus sp. ALD_SL1]|uniref:ATP-binding protein n=1 Tax=Pontibacillus sp. ALD_SL1 TaxID=2777185 RepID=UPI001A95C663|nr:ATP-binding protein [Pontibacillus sp. ALD_SL1]QSS99684.1 PAS domain-containing protein [Pontibacillus sp. ALD_SL1]
MGFNTYIEQSKRRCEEDYRLEPTEAPALQIELTDAELEERKQKLENALPVIQHFMEKVIYYMNGTPIIVSTTDEEGYMIHKFGDQSMMEMIDAFGIHNGVRFRERVAGTNSIALSLLHEEPIGLVGRDHYHEALHGIACYSAPFHYGEDARISGTISIMTTLDYESQFHLGLLSSAVDSIERELRLQEKNNKLEILNQIMINSTPLGMIMTDEEGCITDYNAALEKLVEYSMEERLDKGDTKTYVIKPYVDHVLLTGEKLENKEVTLSFDDGQREKICQLDVLPVYDGDEVIGTFAQFRDMTNYYELQEKLIESEKLSTLGKFSAGLAHEIRNPLTSIIGLTQLLKETNAQNKYLEIITSELDRMKNLVNQFVLLGKPSSVQPAPCNLHDLLEETIELMKSSARLQNVRIEFESNQKDLVMTIDEAKMKQAFINFIKNAFESMENGGVVQVRLVHRLESNEVEVTIEDEGEGMTPDQVSNIGTLFYTSKENGLGMGLSISLEIIKAHHGKVEFDSEKGRGTKVELRFPVESRNTSF